MHISIPVENTIEILDVIPLNPLISKCQIKVCYVGPEPNRNRSIITKDVAKEMAKTIPGSPIVGFFNEKNGDFEEHNRMIDVSNGKFDIIDTTKAYGYIDSTAKIWFQKFLDDGIEHEYLMTEGYIWTDIYPESKRIIERGNNQSMELHEKLTKGEWTKNRNGSPSFFIINEAIIQKLCILGENVEPCFEGAGIAAQFSFDDNFKFSLLESIKELKAALQEGGETHMIENEKVLDGQEEILEPETDFKKKNPDEEEEKKDSPDSQKKDNDDSEDKDKSDDSKKDEEDDDEDDKKKKLNHAASEEDEDKKCPECGKPKSECTCDEDDKKKYSLEDIPEYVELSNNYAALKQEKEALEAEIAPLREFKANADREKKQAMIDSFYMLSDADKADVVANINTYSIDDIEAKLAIICVRNKVSFNLDDDKQDEDVKDPMVYNFNDNGNDGVPAWIKAVRETAKTMI